jgi:hypothetical protein
VGGAMNPMSWWLNCLNDGTRAGLFGAALIGEAVLFPLILLGYVILLEVYLVE